MSELPFPSEAVVNPYSSDHRKNGSIYAISPVKAEIEKFENLLIRPDDFLNRVRLAYLWSKGDQQSGRGMGKTALLRYFRQRINKDWGATEFKNQFNAVVVYVAFPAQIDRRYMEQLALSALVDICRNGVLDASRAALRLKHLTDDQAKAIMTNEDGSEDGENLLNDTILTAKSVDVVKLNDAVIQDLTTNGVQNAPAKALARGEFEKYLRSYRNDGNLEPFYVPRDTRILDYSRSILFNDVVNYLRAAGFAGAYLFVDDIENLVDQMARKARIEFAKEFAMCTVRPGYSNTEHNFFSCVLTTHQQASVGLSSAWGDAGLSAIARLDPTSPNSVELPMPSKDQAREIIIAHLDFYRTNQAEKGTIKPFTEDGIEALLKSKQMLHPRLMLSSAAQVVFQAAQLGKTVIDAEVVNAAMDTKAVIQTADVTDGIDGAM
ncbi:MAG TPA: hypothetical protein VGO57_04905 [Verrucomicrobiae bacterium]